MKSQLEMSSSYPANDFEHVEMRFRQPMDERVHIADPLQMLVLFGGREETVEVSVRHDGLFQLPQVLFQCAGDGFALEHFGLRFFVEERQPLGFSLFGVESHLQELVDLGADAAHSVKAFLLQATRLQALDALFHEGKTHVVDAVLVFRHRAALTRRQIHRLFAVHRIQPRFSVFLRQRLESVHDARSLVERQIEAKSLLEV